MNSKEGEGHGVKVTDISFGKDEGFPLQMDLRISKKTFTN